MKRFIKNKKKITIYYLMLLIPYILLIVKVLSEGRNTIFLTLMLCGFIVGLFSYMDDRRYTITISDNKMVVNQRLPFQDVYTQVVRWERIKAIRYYRYSLWRGIEISNGYYAVKIPIYSMAEWEELLDIILDKTKDNHMIHVDDKVREIQRNQY